MRQSDEFAKLGPAHSDKATPLPHPSADVNVYGVKPRHVRYLRRIIVSGASGLPSLLADIRKPMSQYCDMGCSTRRNIWPRTSTRRRSGLFPACKATRRPRIAGSSIYPAVQNGPSCGCSLSCLTVTFGPAPGGAGVA